jgi:hypothetical protein
MYAEEDFLSVGHWPGALFGLGVLWLGLSVIVAARQHDAA